MTVIQVSKLGKAYKKYPTRWARLAEWVSIKKTKKHQLTWVIKDISFTVKKGESLGIVGINGTGKSTLLKMITGTTSPTEGTIQVHGRVAALLELGLGFHPDFTGRENVMLSGQLLGISHSELNQLMPQIEAFAEIGEYIDQPVRIYSSGMQMRLAFSVATAKRPDILIVDEALSVGDAYFQHKSFERIRAFREEGTTLLIVSHDKSAIQAICDKAILLDSGQIAKEGTPEEVFDYYNALIAKKENSIVTSVQNNEGKFQTTSGTGEAKVKDISLHNSKGEKCNTIAVGEPVNLRIKVKIHQSIEKLVLGYGIKDRLGQVMYGTNTWHTKQIVHQASENDEYIYHISFPANFGPGTYSIQTALVDSDSHLTNNYEWIDLALMFNVINIDKTQFVGYQWNEPLISIEKHNG